MIMSEEFRQKELSKVFHAVEFAAKAHAGQFRKGTKIPYLVHPLGAAQILIERGFDEHLAIAALLHDTVEDTEVTVEQVRKEFGEAIAKLVEHASEPPQQTHSWDERKRHTIEHLKTAPIEALIVCVADKLHNIRSIRWDKKLDGEEVWHRFHGTKDEQKWYYEELAKIFSQRLVEQPAKGLADLYDKEVKRVFKE